MYSKASGKRRHVSNEEFLAVYRGIPGDEKSINHREDCRKVVAAVLGRYKEQFSDDELHAIGMTALWKTLQYHRDIYRQKFTTNLHRFTIWECNRELKRKGRGLEKRLTRSEMTEDIDSEVNKSRKNSDNDNIEHMLSCIDMLEHDWQKQLIRQYYLEQLPMEEIGRRNGYSKETARQRIYKTFEALRQICFQTLEEE